MHLKPYDPFFPKDPSVLQEMIDCVGAQATGLLRNYDAAFSVFLLVLDAKLLWVQTE